MTVTFLQGFGAGPFWGGSGSGIFYPEPAPVLVKENMILEFLKTDYIETFDTWKELNDINEVPFNFCELLNK